MTIKLLKLELKSKLNRNTKQLFQNINKNYNSIDTKTLFHCHSGLHYIMFNLRNWDIFINVLELSYSLICL